ncbi:5'-nucleotidase domain-containing protein 3 isoform X2 [Planococcus citri]|uniref:5'-nucleotidase domain-containing protein 3 isoform X2 n=2 Tax=Planococcus citri TaxID=170843 RepID=UPI0031F914C7
MVSTSKYKYVILQSMKSTQSYKLVRLLARNIRGDGDGDGGILRVKCIGAMNGGRQWQWQRQRQRRYCTTSSHQTLAQHYTNTKQLCESKKLPPDVNVEGVFACNQLDLSEIQVYGFDYDYTLACYKPAMGYILYNLGRDLLVNKYKYPVGISELEYDPSFAVRGLHYDIEKGILMKLDSFLQIELRCVYKGLTKIPENEVLKLYKSRKVPIKFIDTNLQSKHVAPKMYQLADLFSVPEMSLLCNISEYFEQNQIHYHPEILFQDVKTCVGLSHVKMHHLVSKDTQTFLEKNVELEEYLKTLLSVGKKLFLITNSPFRFVDNGMKLLLGDKWEDYFDVIIVEARKPRFFTDESRPLRIYDKTTHTNLWDKVTALRKGHIYYQGTINNLLELTGWKGPEVLYFGDHPYTDLADVTLEHGWRTGAILSELTHEIRTLNTEKFKSTCNWLQMLTQLIEEQQDSRLPDAAVHLAEWQMECNQLRELAKSLFNKQFGSVFRTHSSPTYFSRRLFRFADIYTSSVTNLMRRSVHHTFYPRRGVMPHEYASYFV